MSLDFTELFGKRGDLIKPGLERISQAYQFLGHEARLPKAILVAGTNGKGTTAGFIFSLLARKYKVGLFSSPHLCELSERVQVFGQEISDEDIYHQWKKLEQKLPVELYEQLSFFEICTLVAFEVFCEHHLDYVVLEVGLGGRLDATNIVNPIASIVTSIDFDHCQWLGSSIYEIAREKLGIQRKGIPLFFGERVREPKKRDLELALSEVVGVQVYLAGKDFGYKQESQHCFYIDEKQRVSLNLPHILKDRPQCWKDNFALAFGCLVHLGLDVDFEDITLTANTFAGRCSRLKIEMPGDSSMIHLDVCHNPASVLSYAEYMKSQFPHIKVPCIAGFLADKDVDGMLEILQRVFDPLVIFKVDDTRAFDPTNLDVRAYSSLGELYEGFLKKNLFQYQHWGACGSFLAIGEILRFFSCSAKHHNLTHLCSKIP